MRTVASSVSLPSQGSSTGRDSSACGIICGVEPMSSTSLTARRRATSRRSEAGSSKACSSRCVSRSRFAMAQPDRKPRLRCGFANSPPEPGRRSSTSLPASPWPATDGQGARRTGEPRSFLPAGAVGPATRRLMTFCAGPGRASCRVGRGSSRPTSRRCTQGGRHWSAPGRRTNPSCSSSIDKTGASTRLCPMASRASPRTVRRSVRRLVRARSRFGLATARSTANGSSRISA
jgi:hypothetical protein